MAESEAELDVELTEIPASEILDKIQKGEPVRYDHVRIVGDLDLSKLELPKETDKSLVDSPIRITNSQIEEIVHLGGIFRNEINFDHTHFNKTANFGATFSRKADFGGATFNGDAHFREAKFNGGAYFREAIFGYASFMNATFSWDVDFSGATFSGYAGFGNVVFSRNTDFKEATFCGKNTALLGEAADFKGATFSKKTDFRRATFSTYVGFGNVVFNEYTDFRGATFGDNADFEYVTFKYVTLGKATFSGYTDFHGAIFSGYASFSGARFTGEVLTFKDAVFYKPESQEDACRRAKNVLAKAGNRDEEAYHFYREMEAIRIQKGVRENSGRSVSYVFFETDKWSWRRYFWYDAIEWVFVQMMFGYGVHFERLITSWAIIVVLFAGLYYRSDVISGASNAFDCLKVSFATAIAPGYIAVIMNPGNSLGGYKIASGYYQAAAMIETLLGTFLWAGFIATFAKKYMK